MKKTVFSILALTLCFSALNAQKNKHGIVPQKTVEPIQTLLATQQDSVSYAFGVYLGADLNRNLATFPGMEIKRELLLRGVRQSLYEDSIPMTADFAEQFFQKYIMDAQQAVQNEKKAAGVKFLAENGKRSEVQTTASGLQYEILRNADGPKPQATDFVRVHYHGSLIDGTVFDSSVQRGEPITFGLSQVIPGWTEGVQLMSVGAKYKFYIPYQLGYGERGAGQQIPPFSALIFEVELLDINPPSEGK